METNTWFNKEQRMEIRDLLIQVVDMEMQICDYVCDTAGEEEYDFEGKVKMLKSTVEKYKENTSKKK